MHEAGLDNIEKVIDLIIAIKGATPDHIARLTENAFITLHNLNARLIGFGNHIAKATAKRSQKLVSTYGILKPMQKLLAKIIAFFYHPPTSDHGAIA